MFRYSKSILIVLFVTILSNYSKASEVNFEIVAPRPMAEGTMILAEQLGSVITYEDHPFQYMEELRKSVPNSNILVPKEASISYGYDPANTNSEVILGLINKHKKEGNSGEFTLIKTSEIYNVLPVRYRNRDGQLVNHSSPLDAKVTLSLKGTNCLEAIENLCEAVSQSNNNSQIRFAAMGVNIFITTPFSQEFSQEPARNVLNEILNTINEKIHKPLTWQLKFDPRSDESAPHIYYLNFYPFSPTNASFMRLRIESQRPMAIAARVLEKKFGKTINYEDPPYVCHGDVFGDSASKSLGGGFIDINWQKSNSIDNVLRLLTETPIKPRGNPENFKFIKSEGKYYIYPFKSKDKQGNLVSRTPIMNATLSFNAQNVNGTALLESICTKLSDLTKENIVLGAIPEKTLSDALVTKAFPRISINNQKAYLALNQLLGEISSEISWQLLFNPTLERYELMLYDK